MSEEIEQSGGKTSPSLTCSEAFELWAQCGRDAGVIEFSLSQLVEVLRKSWIKGAEWQRANPDQEITQNAELRDRSGSGTPPHPEPTE